MLTFFYRHLVLAHPTVVLALIGVLMLFSAWQSTKLEVDASAETLVLEDDEDLRITRQVNERYGNPDFLVVTFTPPKDLLATETQETIRKLQGDLERVKGVKGVTSMLDVPLLESPPKPVKELVKDVPTLDHKDVDLELARKELLTSPIYNKLLVSPDFKTTVLQVNLVEDPTFKDFIVRRYKLREKEHDGTLTVEEAAQLAQLQLEFKAHRDKVREELHETIADVRAVMDRYRENNALFLGGVSMIADDLISFVKNDLAIFGLGVLIFLIITLWTIFRQKRWVLIPILTCGMSVLATAGLLGMFGWEVTVISSNFISLQLIITMAITIHLIVRYRELLRLHPEAEQKELVLEATISMAKPCFYMMLTTIAGFSSLLLSGILPVINFGWMMSAGIGVSLFLTFLIFPAVLVRLEKVQPNVTFESRFRLTRFLAGLTERFGKGISMVSMVLGVLCVIGVMMLRVENSFIDYFKESTEIYQGMKVIDQQLGGTTPLDVTLRFDAPAAAPAAASQPTADDPKKDEGEGGEFDAFEKEFEETQNEAQYWFTADKMAQVERVHDYLDSLPETGKVLSLGTLQKVGRTINDGKPLDNFMWAVVYNELPEEFREIILKPYVSVEHNEVRFSIRILDSEPSLRRNELLQRINNDLEEKLGLPPERFQVTGIMVLYNNMLQSLFSSQILTLGVVVLALMGMFMLLFQSVKIAYIAILPNVLSVGTVLGLMGWAGIPLDLMTITIASISVGIAVDDTIHYIHRFKEEFPLDRDYLATMKRCHSSIGHAMYYTSVTIIIGFSILVLSNFIPSIYFGLLTGLAMVIALLASLTLLPRMILVLKPFGPGAGDEEKPVETEPAPSA